MRLPSAFRGARAALWVYTAFAVVALPVIVLALGDHRWFHGDEWIYIFDRDLGSINDLFRPGNAHWSTVPIVQYKLTQGLFGLDSYVPYQVGVVVEHLVVASLMRVVMRRSGVDPWIATSAAVAFIFFGAGSINIIWGFQIGFNSALIFGLLQLIAADHAGPIGRRDVAGLAAGLLSIMAAGVGVTMVATVGLSLLLRRRWRAAAFHTVPLGLIYLVWASITHPDASSGAGNPTPKFIVEWVVNGEVGFYVALGGFAVVSVLLAAVTAVGGGLMWKKPRRDARPAVPIALAAGGALFLLTTSIGRWIFGLDAARTSRFVHVVAALTLPLLALAATSVAKRLGPLGIAAMSVLFLVGIGPGLDDWDTPPFNEQYYDEQERVVRTVTRVPEAALVPASVLPAPDPARTRFLEIGDLLGAVESGELSETTFPLTDAIHEEMRLRIGFSVDPTTGGVIDAADRCPKSDAPTFLATEKGDIIRLTSAVRVTSVGPDDEPLARGIVFSPTLGQDHIIELEGLRLRFSPAPGLKAFQVCDPR